MKQLAYALLGITASQGFFYLCRIFPEIREAAFLVLLVTFVGAIAVSRFLPPAAREGFEVAFLLILTAIALGMTAWLN